MAEDSSKQDDQQKQPSTILEQEIEIGLDELERPARGLILSALSAGLDIGFSILVVAMILQVTSGSDSLAIRLVMAGGYAIGFIFVIFGRSELFTEHTTLAFLPVLGGRARVRQLMRLWALVYVANVAGTAVFAGLLATVGPSLEILDVELLMEHAIGRINHSWWVILLSAVLAGWMMGLVSWLITAARSTTSEIVFVTLVTATIGFTELHHCIVGSVEMLTSLFASGYPSVTDYGRFMLLATSGNIIGGVVFVAIIKFGHATSTRGRFAPQS